MVPEILLFVLLGASSGALRTAQVAAPLSWLRPRHLAPLCSSGRLENLQMLVLANTCCSEEEGKMALGMETVEMFLDACPQLCALGNLRYIGVSLTSNQFPDKKSPFLFH